LICRFVGCVTFYELRRVFTDHVFIQISKDNSSKEKLEIGGLFMDQEKGRRVGEVKVKKYILKNDNTLLRLDKATVRTCSLPEDEAQARSCQEFDKVEGRSCEELVLVYRPGGCVKETEEVDLDETTTIAAEVLTTEK
jgi:hypothetical protein